MPKKRTKRHWVDEYLVPLEPCDKSGAIEKARKYADPQAAWDAWDDGAELLWNLEKCGEKDTLKLVLCVCEIAERVLPIFEAEYPDDNKPRKAIEAARRYAENPSEENRLAVNTACDDVCAVRVAAYYTARAAARALVYDTLTARDAVCAVYAVNVVYDAANAVNDNVAEKKAQADIVRKYFPTSPFVKEEN